MTTQKSIGTQGWREKPLSKREGAPQVIKEEVYTFHMHFNREKDIILNSRRVLVYTCRVKDLKRPSRPCIRIACECLIKHKINLRYFIYIDNGLKQISFLIRNPIHDL